MRSCPRCLTPYYSEVEYCALDGERLVFGQQDPLIGRLLGNYRLEQRLGTGGTGCVYFAHDRNSGRPMAIKLLFGELVGDNQAVERFRREAEAIKRMTHPNIVRVIDHGRSSAGLVYLAMEHAEGESLKDYLQQHSPLPANKALHICEQIALGLAEAHRLGYVHRDLKPGNIIINSSTPLPSVKILDFGIVSSLREQDTEDRLTKTGYIVGTPTYMAPEQIDPTAISPQADIYALGVILYEMLLGRPPFSGSLEQVLVAKMTEEVPELAKLKEYSDLVNSMLAKTPEDRPKDGLALVQELRQYSLGGADQTLQSQRPPIQLVPENYQSPQAISLDSDEFPEDQQATVARPAVVVGNNTLRPVGEDNFDWSLDQDGCAPTALGRRHSWPPPIEEVDTTEDKLDAKSLSEEDEEIDEGLKTIPTSIPAPVVNSSAIKISLDSSGSEAVTPQEPQQPPPAEDIETPLLPELPPLGVAPLASAADERGYSDTQLSPGALAEPSDDLGNAATALDLPPQKPYQPPPSPLKAAPVLAAVNYQQEETSGKGLWVAGALFLVLAVVTILITFRYLSPQETVIIDVPQHSGQP